jgi:hypothetical protein
MSREKLLLKTLQVFTQLNLLFGGISVVSAIITWLTLKMGLYQQVAFIPSTLRDVLFVIFVTYWEFWFILAVPPIIGYLRLSRKEPKYWGLTVTNIAPVLILFVIKMVYGFQVPGLD